MPELGELFRRRPVRDVADLAQVGARRENERLAGDRDGGDLAGCRASPLGSDRLAELEQSERTEGARARVVPVVVEGDEREGLSAREGNVAHEGVRDDLVLRQGSEVVELRHYFFFFPL